MHKPPLCECHWLDANVSSGWHDLKKTKPELLKVWTAGYLVDETDDVLVIAQSVEEDYSAADLIHIPKAQVLELRAGLNGDK